MLRPAGTAAAAARRCSAAPPPPHAAARPPQPRRAVRARAEPGRLSYAIVRAAIQTDLEPLAALWERAIVREGWSRSVTATISEEEAVKERAIVARLVEKHISRPRQAAAPARAAAAEAARLAASPPPPGAPPHDARRHAAAARDAAAEAARLRRRRCAAVLVARPSGAAAGGPLAGYALLSVRQPEAALPPPFPSGRPHRLHLDALAVSPEHRRRGLARALLARCERIGSAWGWRSLWLEVDAANAGACALYEAAGYAPSLVRGWPWRRRVLISKVLPRRAPAPPAPPPEPTGRASGAYLWSPEKES